MFRFGWIRQLSGGNYYISCRQVFESDRKIKAISLLKFSGFTIDEIEKFVIPPQEPNECLDLLADEIADKLDIQQTLTDNDFTTLAYVCGFVVKSVCNTTRCKSCEDCLIEKVSDLQEELEEGHNVMKYVKQVDRGGLTKPTEYAWKVSTHCFNVFQHLKKSEELFQKFLSASNHMVLFQKITERCFDDNIYSILSYSNFCNYNHELTYFISKSLFNCLSKNYVNTLENVKNKKICDGKIKKFKT